MERIRLIDLDAEERARIAQEAGKEAVEQAKKRGLLTEVAIFPINHRLKKGR